MPWTDRGGPGPEQQLLVPRRTVPRRTAASCPRDESRSRTRAAGETVGHSVSSRVPNASDEVSSPSNQASSAPRRPEERKAARASLTRRARSASRPDLYGPGRATMEATRSLTRSRLTVARAKRTRRLTSSLQSGGGGPQGPAKHLAHPGVSLDPPDLHRLLDAHLSPWGRCRRWWSAPRPPHPAKAGPGRCIAGRPRLGPTTRTPSRLRVGWL